MTQQIFISDLNLSSLEQTVIKATLLAGEHLRKNAFNTHNIEWKAKNDPVTKHDKIAEKIIQKELSKNLLINYIGEEYGFVDNRSDYTAIIDPLDGTKSYLRQNFLCAVSIGIQKNDSMIIGSVYDFMKDILYFSSVDKSQIGINEEISDKTMFRMHNSKILPFTINFPSPQKRIITDKKMALKTQKMYPKSSIYIREGSIALSLAQTACGQYDQILLPEKQGKVWDVAAGYTLLNLAGFNIVGLNGEKYDIFNDKNGIKAWK